MQIITPMPGVLGTTFVKSEALDARRSLFYYLPPSYERDVERRYPCIWLLHGMYGAESDWVVKGSAHLTAERLMLDREMPEAILVFPNDGLSQDGTGYRNNPRGRHADYIDELVDFADATWRVGVADAEGRPHAIIGLSMGGYGAFYTADRLRPRVRAAFSHSGALGQGFYGDDSLWQRLIAGQVGAHPLALGADCGRDDPLLEGNRAWHQAMQEADLDVVYREFPGGHDWPYWSEHVAESLRFMGQAFAT